LDSPIQVASLDAPRLRALRRASPQRTQRMFPGIRESNVQPGGRGLDVLHAGWAGVLQGADVGRGKCERADDATL